MSTYVVTFRIADRTVGGKSYQDRYDALIENLTANHDGIWFDTTSFYLVGSHEDARTFAERIVHGLSPQYDMLFTFDPDDMSACYLGSVAALDVLKSFFPNSEKVG
jgi:hypothetical protein